MLPATKLTHAWWPAALTGLVVRGLALLFTEDQWGDAPARLELVQRWVAAPSLRWDFTHAAQFGPLPTNVAGALASVFGFTAGTRGFVLLCGLVAIPLVFRLASRFGGPAAGVAAAWALALSPLHVQASTTFASEAVYVAVALGAVLRALAGDPWGFGAFAFAATTTRYDAWIWLPLAAAWWGWRAPASRSKKVLGLALLTLGPASILVANLVDSGDPLRPLSWVAGEHVALARAAQDRWGSWQWRVGMAFYWPVAAGVVLTPGFAIALFSGVIRAIRSRAQALVPVSFAAAPPVLYATRAVVLGSFWPMARFALGPSALGTAAMPALSRRSLAICIVLALACDAGLVAVGGDVPEVNALSPISRLDGDVRAGVEAVRSATGPVVIDVSPRFEDLLVTWHAGVDRWNTTHSPETLVPQRIVAFDGAPIATALARDATFRGARFVKTGSHGRVAWWDRAP